ncbi:3-dehydroquinate synthase [Nocardioides bruguierae]|uniref:3-dehydroquinate synthase n=1 Tax=Nocardioides bruguierae TaxID=2945102 RepID=UPI0020201D24|nr:3-dehydroquinate synthase [Nocardioides bruguierae]MCL8024240.1 3-dehydroquinate synthase [Nocardioides bruguierae]
MSTTDQPTVLHVGGSAPYDVVVGHGVAQRLVDLLGERPTRVALVVAEALVELAGPVREALAGAYRLTEVVVPDGEAAKTPAVAARCWDALGEAGFTRSDAVVTFGGGATTDLGGFVAASWLRGVPVVHVPTTLLAMVDAAVGGKTGVNTDAGKNLVGAFHEPAGVLCDLSLLAGLPRRDLVAGMGEVVKCGFIADERILELVETQDVEAVLDTDGPVLRELVERAVAVKIDVVVGDLKEAGGSELTGAHPGREALNYGHTMGHAIERAEHYRMRHGDGVAIGCCYVAEVARLAGVLDEATAARHRAAFARVGLPTGYDGAGFEELLAGMKLDKKTRGDQLRLVVLDAVGRPRILAGPAEEHLRAADALMRAHA